MSYALHSSTSHTLPPEIQNKVGYDFQPVGTGIYRKFGLPIYEITLWASGGKWDATKTCILGLAYKRALSKDIVITSLIESIRDQSAADDITIDKWEKALNKCIPSVQTGDTMFSIVQPSRPLDLFHNDAHIAHLDDLSLSRVFLNIWLGEHADQDLKSQLLGQN